MEDFYRSQRRRFDVLMEGGEPVGGRWNLDHENRERVWLSCSEVAAK